MYEFTERNFGMRFLVKAPIVDAVFIHRIIDAVSEGRNVVITEIGAGSGMLGATLLNEGIKYRCIDVTQSFYLLQNWLLPIFAGSTDELVIGDYKDSQFVHIPYWKIWDMRFEEIYTDIFTCNHALLEMTPTAIVYYLKLAKMWMKNSQIKAFVMRSWGWEMQCKKKEAIDIFQKQGFELIYLDNYSSIIIFKLIEDRDIRYVNYEELEHRELYFTDDGEKIYHRLLSEEKSIL